MRITLLLMFLMLLAKCIVGQKSAEETFAIGK